MQLLYSPESENLGGDGLYKKDPPATITARLKYSAQIHEASQRRIDNLIVRFGVDLREWFIAPRGAWEVHDIGEAETQAGAMIGDLAVLCDVPDSRTDLDSSVKAHENFRGVYTTRTEPKLRCYYFAPLEAN